MRRRNIIAIIALLLIAAGGITWRSCGHSAGKAKPKVADPWATPVDSGNEAQILADKRREHGDAPADLTPASVSGRVTRSADGTGVAAAVVTLAPDEFGAGMMGGLDGGDRSIIVVADDHGVWSATSVPPGTYVMTAASSGLLPGSRDAIALAAGEKKTGIDLALDAGGSNVHGTISDIGGGPVADARVSVHRGDMAGFKNHTGSFAAITGADGVYQITLPDGEWDAKVTQADYTTADKSFEVRGQPVTLDFILTPGATIRGQVVSRADGKPVAGAIVRADGGHSGPRHNDDNTVATSDADGNFVLRGLGSGAIDVSATARGFASSAPTSVELGIGEEVEGVKVLVDRAFTISGFVVRKAKQSEGVPGIRVGVFSLGTREAAAAPQPSGRDGYFEITGVRPANYMLFAVGSDVMPDFGKPVVVKDKDVDDVLITVETGATLSGKLEPGVVASLSLQMEPDKIGLGNMFDMAKAAMVAGEANAQGAFSLRNCPPGEFTLVATVTDGRSGKLKVKITEDDQSGLVVPLEARASIAGRVVDPSGVPVVGVRVKATPVNEGGGMNMRMYENDGAVTAADGGYRIVGLDPGKVALAVSDDLGTLGWADAAHKAEPRKPIELDLTGAQEVTGENLTVEARDGVIRGVVIGIDGKPEPDSWVTATFIPPDDGPGGHRVTITIGGNEGGGMKDDHDGDDEKEAGQWGRDSAAPVLTGADGRFTVDHLRRGTYQLVADGPKGNTRARKTGVKSGDNVTLTLETLGSLAGTVTAGGAPVPDYTIECRGPAGSNERHVVAADGAYAFDRLPPGKYSCSATSDAGPAVGEVAIKGAPARLDLTIGTWATLVGKVVDVLTGAPMASLKVAAMGANGGTSGMEDFLTGGGPTTDATGTFEIGKQSPGKGNVMIFDGGMSGFHVVAHKGYTLTAGQRLDLGTIKGIAPRIGPAGTLGMTTTGATVLKVETVVAGGPAAAAGVKVGDVVTSVRGHTVAELGAETAGDLLEPEHVTAGEAVALILTRGTAPPITVSVTAAAVP